MVAMFSSYCSLRSPRAIQHRIVRSYRRFRGDFDLIIGVAIGSTARFSDLEGLPL